MRDAQNQRLCTTGTATVNVGAAPLPPVEIDPVDLTTTATVPVVADLTFNHDRGRPDVHRVVCGAEGTGTVDATGRVTYTPTGQFTGRDPFTVQACSVLEPANCGTAVVSVTWCSRSRATTPRSWSPAAASTSPSRRTTSGLSVRRRT